MEIMKKNFLTAIATVMVLTFASLSNAGISETESKVDTLDIFAGPQPAGAAFDGGCFECIQP